MTADYTAKPMTVDHVRKIAERAYRLWESEGQPHGRALDHWLRAEAELAIDPAPQVTTSSPKPSTPKQAHGKPQQR